MDYFPLDLILLMDGSTLRTLGLTLLVTVKEGDYRVAGWEGVNAYLASARNIS
jgi:hypothetical protein